MLQDNIISGDNDAMDEMVKKHPDTIFCGCSPESGYVYWWSFVGTFDYGE